MTCFDQSSVSSWLLSPSLGFQLMVPEHPPSGIQSPPAVSLERSCVGELRHPANSQHHLRSAQLFPVRRLNSYLFIYLYVHVCGCYSLVLGVPLSCPPPPYIFEKGPPYVTSSSGQPASSKTFSLPTPFVTPGCSRLQTCATMSGSPWVQTWVLLSLQQVLYGLSHLPSLVNYDP